MKTILAIVKEFCKRTGLAEPTFVVSNPDPQIRQLWGAMNELCEDLTMRKAWQAVRKEKVHTSTAAEDQGNIYTLTDDGFQGIIQGTMFDRTQNLTIMGSISPQDWQAEKALAGTGPYYRYRIRANRLLFNPALPANHTIAWEYHSSTFVTTTGGTLVSEFLLDSDTLVFPDLIPIAWLRWWWKKEKGLDYAEEFRHYEACLSSVGAREDSPQAVDMGTGEKTLRPGVIIPDGNWPLP